MSLSRVTVTLPTELLDEVDLMGRNRSRFIHEAVRREVERRRREELRSSLQNPHGEVHEASELGYSEWAGTLPPEDVSELVDPGGGTAVRWIPERGWIARDDARPRGRRR